MASVESVIWTFRAANVPFAKLEEAWAAAQQLGGSQLSWQLQISQLQLNPPLGVTVPEVAEYLAAYFGSVNNSATTALPGDTEDQEAASGTTSTSPRTSSRCVSRTPRITTSRTRAC